MNLWQLSINGRSLRLMSSAFGKEPSCGRHRQSKLDFCNFSLKSVVFPLQALLHSKFRKQLPISAKVSHGLTQSPQHVLVQTMPFTLPVQSPHLHQKSVMSFNPSQCSLVQPNHNVLLQTIQAPLVQVQSPLPETTQKTVYNS